MKSIPIKDEIIDRIREIEKCGVEQIKESRREIYKDKLLYEFLLISEKHGVPEDVQDLYSKVTNYLNALLHSYFVYNIINKGVGDKEYIRYKVEIPTEIFDDLNCPFLNKPLIEIYLYQKINKSETNLNEYVGVNKTIFTNATVTDGKFNNIKIVLSIPVDNKFNYLESKLISLLAHEVLHIKSLLNEWNKELNNSKSRFNRYLVFKDDDKKTYFDTLVEYSIMLMDGNEQQSRGLQVYYEMDEISLNPYITDLKEMLFHCPVVEYTMNMYKDVIDGLEEYLNNKYYDEYLREKYSNLKLTTVNKLLKKIYTARINQYKCFYKRLEAWVMKKQNINEFSTI